MLFPLIISIVLGLAALFIIGAYQGPLRTALIGVVDLVQTPFSLALEAMGGVVRWLVARIREIFVPELPAPEEKDPARTPHSRPWPGWPVIGALLSLAACAIFLCADFWLVVLTLQALGFSDGGLQAPASADLLSGAALMAVAFFWGIVLLDTMGFTHLGPWANLKGKGRRGILIAFSLVCIALTLVVAGLLGAWRGTQVAGPLPVEAEMIAQDFGGIQESPLVGSSPSFDASDPGEAIGELAEPGRLERAAPVVVGALLPALVSISAVFSGWGVAATLGYLWGLILGLILIPLGLLCFPFRVGVFLCGVLVTGINAIMDVLAGLGCSIWNWLCRFEGLRKALKLRSLEELGSLEGEPSDRPRAEDREPSAPLPPSEPPPEPRPIPGPEEAPKETWNPLGL